MLITINLDERDAEFLNDVLRRLNPAFLTSNELRVIYDITDQINNTLSLSSLGKRKDNEADPDRAG